MLISAVSLHSRLVQLAVAALCLMGIAYFIVPSSHSLSLPIALPHQSVSEKTPPANPPVPPANPSAPPANPPAPLHRKPNHPIDTLIQRSDDEFKALLAKETRTVGDAAEAYRARRGRQPPPLFDVWYTFATNHSAIVIEDFFDRIYHDLNPFWGVPASQIRAQASDFIHRISIRNGNTTGRTDIERREWIELWKDMVQSVAPYLPDIDIPINVMDESRIVVPWEEIDIYMAKEKETKVIVPPEKLITNFKGLESAIKDMDKHSPPAFDAAFSGEGPYWELAVVGCPPESPARNAYIETDFSTPPPLSKQYSIKTYEGYVQNWTFTCSPCDHPNLQGLHGTFVEPISIANTKVFFPLFGGSKLPMNNEILLPPAMYWTLDPFYSGGDYHGGVWEEKKDKVIWRGSASGGRNKVENWTRFQRHRFVSMINATNIAQLEDHPDRPAPNFVLPSNNTYNLAVQHPNAPPHAFSNWVSHWADAAVVHLLCFPGTGKPTCNYTAPYFTIAQELPMQAQYSNKYLPDIDGNSFSGRYRGFLRSTSLPIKATIYQEWHDSRLIAWKHFIPMDNEFLDIYGIVEYFLGNADLGIEGHDDVARALAREGEVWAEKVLRREDMSVYVFRLLLEYARVCDDRREVMGWAETAETRVLV